MTLLYCYSKTSNGGFVSVSRPTVILYNFKDTVKQLVHLLAQSNLFRGLFPIFWTRN